MKPKDVCKRLSSRYLKEDYAKKVMDSHLSSTSSGISKDDFILMDGTDISKKHAKYMQGLEYVKNGDTGEIGLGHNVLNINAMTPDGTMAPLYSKAYSYQMGALSSNNEVKKAVRHVTRHIGEKGCWVFDRGADNAILKDFFIAECPQAIIRLKSNTKLCHKQEEHQVSALANKIDFLIAQSVTKIKKDRPVVEHCQIGAIPVSYTIKGSAHALWLVVSRNQKHGGLCYLLVKSALPTAIEVAKWAFEGYGLRWKIEQCHRHVKQQYKLEAIQMKTFEGLRSMLAVLTVAMFMIYRKIRSIHFNLLLDTGYNYLNKHVPRELVNFTYCKISKLVSILLMPVRNRWKIDSGVPDPFPGQLNLKFN